MKNEKTALEILEAEKFGIEPKKVTELMGNLPQIQSERSVLETQYNEVIKMDLEEYSTRTLARELRLKIRDNRTKGIIPWHKSTKDVFLKGGQFVDALKNREVIINERMEETLDNIEKHYENLEKARIKELQDARITEVSKYVESTEGLVLGDMDIDFWEAFLSSKKKLHKAKLQAEKEVEKERLAEEKRVEQERSKQLIENARLKAEALVKEKALIAEREANAKLIAEEAKKREALAEETRIKLKAEAEARALVEKALKDKEEAERKLLEAKAAEEVKAKQEADKLAKAPIKQKLRVWTDSFEINRTYIDPENALAKDIILKFEGFKKWAKLEIEKL